MSHRKKDRAGFEDRIGVLRRHFSQTDEIVEEALNRFRRSDVARDDIVDALASAVTGLLGNDALSSIPREPQIDRRGLPMEMLYYTPNTDRPMEPGSRPWRTEKEE